ncbi:hypothetical protein [Methylobacterium oryzae]|uniref:hypothetical protein n=1 Tax=Methylobacterium oryzae TaxID=334852 RepID=UPI001F1B9118|nr:hypothetical protein [Methylobacterium oryzae]UIN35148.1 hypothetical protein LXM90_01190 [Methylobacterium oryzae]
MSDDEEQPQRPKPDGRQKDAMDRAMKRYDARSEPLAFADQPEGTNKLSISGKHSDRAGHVLHLLDTFGTASAEFAQNSVGQVAAVMRSRGEARPDDTSLNAGIGAVSGIAPENEIEAMLAVQMVGTHAVAMEMLTKAKLASTTDQLERYGALATKLLRTYTTQIDALSKLRRKGEQTVRVEHVHVYEGGQAIVGNVTQGGRGHLENGHQAHAPTDPRALAVAPVSPVLCHDPARDVLPVASGEREGPVPNARRRQGKRRSEG